MDRINDMENTIDNKKIVLTNRVAIGVLIFVIGTTFSATTFYNQTRYQELVSAQNAESAKVNKERIEEIYALLQEQIKSNHELDMQYTEQEVIGLRTDWERDRLDQNKRFEKLEK